MQTIFPVEYRGLPLGGQEEICLFLDFDQRFCLERFRDLIKERIKKIMENHGKTPVYIKQWFNSCDFHYFESQLLDRVLLIRPENFSEALEALEAIEKFCGEQEFGRRRRKEERERKSSNNAATGISPPPAPAAMGINEAADRLREFLNNRQFLRPLYNQPMGTAFPPIPDKMQYQVQNKRRIKTSAILRGDEAPPLEGLQKKPGEPEILPTADCAVGCLIIDNVAAFHFQEKDMQNSVKAAREFAPIYAQNPPDEINLEGFSAEEVAEIQAAIEEEKRQQNKSSPGDAAMGDSDLKQSSPSPPLVSPLISSSLDFSTSFARFYEIHFFPHLFSLLSIHHLSCITTKPVYYHYQLEMFQEWPQRISSASGGSDFLGNSYQKHIKHKLLLRMANHRSQQLFRENYWARYGDSQLPIPTLYEGRFYSVYSNNREKENPFGLSPVPGQENSSTASHGGNLTIHSQQLKELEDFYYIITPGGIQTVEII